MKKEKYLTAVFLLAVMSASQLSANPKVERLIDSCIELVNIYETREEKQFLAAQSTSLSEALRAGYCRGVLEEHAQHDRCYKSDWFDRARFIASQYGFDGNYRSKEELLEHACGR